MVEALVVLGLIALTLGPMSALYCSFKRLEMTMLESRLSNEYDNIHIHNNLDSLLSKVTQIESDMPNLAQWEEKNKENTSMYQDFLKKVEL